MGVSTFDYVCACVHGVRMCTPVSGVTRYPDLGFADPGGQEHGGQTRISFAPPACTVLRGLLGSHSWECPPCPPPPPQGHTPDLLLFPQAQVVALEQDQSPARLEAAEQQQREVEREVERLRSAQVQTERTLEARERAHRQRVRGLEEQVLRPGRVLALPQDIAEAPSGGGAGEGWL